MQKMCDDGVRKNLYTLKYVPYWFVTKEQVKLQDDGFIKWCKGYQERKAQKAKIRKKFMPFGWHPSRWWDWCVPED